MVAVLSRLFGLKEIDWILDVVQDSFEAALIKWRYTGIPDNPSAWLMQVAKNKAINEIKKENRTRTISSSVYLSNAEKNVETQFDILLSPHEIKDSQLRLLFTCCHPDLSERNQVIITLHILCGFGVPEIAGALLMNNEAVKKTLTRNKAILRQFNNILETPLYIQSDERIQTVHTILYLVFNEGYKTTRAKEGINYDLCYEAIRLARMMADTEGNHQDETNALLALMFFTISRFPARLGGSEEWLTLEEQDRSKWDQKLIAEGYAYLDKATRADKLTKYHIEAIISSLHCTASAFAETDWKKIAWLYTQLKKIDSSPLVALNRIIAESYFAGNEALAALDQWVAATGFNDLFLINATKADICKRKGDFAEALICYQAALHEAVSPVDKNFLEKKIRKMQEEEGIDGR